MTFDREYYSELLEERNVVAALRYLQRTDLSSTQRDRELGRLVNMTLAETAVAAERGERDRAVFWRALLSWVLREAPPLSSLYREQLRVEFAAFGHVQDAMGSMFGQRAGDRVERAVTEARSRFEDAARAFDSGDTEAALRTVFEQVEHGLREGLREFQNAFAGESNRESGGHRRSRTTDEEPGTAADDGEHDGPVHEVKIEGEDE